MAPSPPVNYRKLFDECFSSSPPPPLPTQPQPASRSLHLSSLPSGDSPNSLVASQDTSMDLLSPTEPAVLPPALPNPITTSANLGRPPSVQEHSENTTTAPDDSIFVRGETWGERTVRRKRTRSQMENGFQTGSSRRAAHSRPTCCSRPERNLGSQPLPLEPSSDATLESGSGVDDDSEEPEEPPLYDFASVVIFHDWWVDLRQHNADEWFLMGGARWEALDSESEDEVDSLFPLFRRYRTAYFPYQVTLRKFLVACLYMYYTHIDTAPPGESSTASRRGTKTYDQLHPFLWDDFIRCLTVTFPPYVNQCQLNGRVPMSAFQYYNTTVLEPTNRKQVVSPTSLRTFVGSGSVEPVHKLFHRTVGILQSNIHSERAFEALRLPIIVEERKAMEAELKENEAELRELLRLQRQIRLRKEKAERQQMFLEARGGGIECEAAPWKEIKRGACDWEPY